MNFIDAISRERGVKPTSKLLSAVIPPMKDFLVERKTLPIILFGVGAQKTEVEHVVILPRDETSVENAAREFIHSCKSPEIVVVTAAKAAATMGNPKDMENFDATNLPDASNILVFAHVTKKSQATGFLVYSQNAFGNIILDREIHWVNNLPSIGHLAILLEQIQENMV